MSVSPITMFAPAQQFFLYEDNRGMRCSGDAEPKALVIGSTIGGRGHRAEEQFITIPVNVATQNHRYPERFEIRDDRGRTEYLTRLDTQA